MFNELIDAKENTIISIDIELLDILLKDHSSNKNIIWATDNYFYLGEKYLFSKQITSDLITGANGEVIRPRVKKTIEEKNSRIRKNAEVFTPSWVCNEQISLLDNEWFGRQNVFNKIYEKGWQTNKEKITFSKGNTWKDYVKSIRMEISCGEGPYLTSRYDAVSGKTIKIEDRIGILDRKFRILHENVINENDWIKLSIVAMKSVYGYDWQGDNVLLARENLLYTYIDYYRNHFNKKPPLDLIKEIAYVISWNIWQMDGIKYVIPNSCIDNGKQYVQLNLFDELHGEKEKCIGCKKGNNNLHIGIYCKIMNWETNRANKFINLVSKR